MRLLLIRHGETQSNVDRLLDTAHPGAPLTPRGQEQAVSLVDRLADEAIDAVYASTLTRAQQTAAPLAEARGLQVQVLDDIYEIQAGVEELSSDWTAYVSMLGSWGPDNLDSGLEQGETAREFMTRFDRALRVVAEQGHRCAAIVSHGAALRVWGLAQRPDLDPSLTLPLRNTEWLEVEGSPHEGWKLLSWAGARLGA